jgi:hypothetical protein
MGTSHNIARFLILQTKMRRTPRTIKLNTIILISYPSTTHFTPQQPFNLLLFPTYALASYTIGRWPFFANASLICVAVTSVKQRNLRDTSLEQPNPCASLSPCESLPGNGMQ